SLVTVEYEMFVLTSVIVTVTPGSANADWSPMFPTRPPFTACARAIAPHPSTKSTAAALALSTRPRRSLIIVPPPRTKGIANVGLPFQGRRGEAESPALKRSRYRRRPLA